MKYLLTTLVLFFSAFYILLGQQYKISDETTVFINGGMLTDSGGETSKYKNNESFVKTICPTDSAHFIKLDFNEFETEKGEDILRIYHNNKLIGESIELSGVTNPGTIISKHESGCLTIYFHSNSSLVYSGFTAEITNTSSTYFESVDKNGGAVCSLAAPFCTSSTYNFPNSINTTSATGADFGCLGSQPNPVWYYMQIENSGDLVISLQQTQNSDGTGAQRDIDFAMWGPYNNTSEACIGIHTNQHPPLQCSFSPSYTETIALGSTGGVGSGLSTPPAALTNQIYMILLTNYSNNPGYISFSQTGGTASTNCSLLSLSVNLLSFTGQNKNGINELKWSAIYHQKVSYFTIEQSSDGFEWKTLGQVEIDENKSNYTLIDNEYNKTINYYRLVEHNQYGTSNRLSTLLIDNSSDYKKIVRIVNIIGQDVNEYAVGLKIYIYEDGTSEKRIN